MVEISEAASFKLKNQKPSVSSSHCLSSTGDEITGKELTTKLNEMLVSLQAVLSMFSTLTNTCCEFIDVLE